MELLELFGAALGGGAVAAVLVKLLDYFFIMPAQHSAEHKKWIREEKLEVYSQLSVEISQLRYREFPANGDTVIEPYSHFKSAHKALLLIEGDEFHSELTAYLVSMQKTMQKFNANQFNKSTNEETKAFHELGRKSGRLMAIMKNSLNK